MLYVVSFGPMRWAGFCLIVLLWCGHQAIVDERIGDTVGLESLPDTVLSVLSSPSLVRGL